MRIYQKKETEEMKMKKFMALLCTAALTCALLAGCGSGESQSAADGTTEEQSGTEGSSTEVSDHEAADNVAALIDAIYVQERSEETDAQC